MRREIVPERRAERQAARPRGQERRRDLRRRARRLLLLVPCLVAAFVGLAAKGGPHEHGVNGVRAVLLANGNFALKTNALNSAVVRELFFDFTDPVPPTTTPLFGGSIERPRFLSTPQGDYSRSASPSESTARGAAVVTESATRGPVLHLQLPERVRTKVHEAISVAREQLRAYASCRALFARLGADGVAKLDGTWYYPASREQERKYCRRRGSMAITTVGGSAVVLCRSFARLSAHQAAIILLHEALHFAGQTEYPLDSDAPDGLTITRWVMKSCRLSSRAILMRGLREPRPRPGTFRSRRPPGEVTAFGINKVSSLTPSRGRPRWTSTATLRRRRTTPSMPLRRR